MVSGYSSLGTTQINLNTAIFIDGHGRGSITHRNDIDLKFCDLSIGIICN